MDPLNPEQRAAVLYGKGHLLITAGPGTGKTLTLSHRIAHLICEGKARPSHILCLTFTRKAAREMAHRIALLLPDLEEGPVRVATFHRFCLDLLRRHTDRIGLPADFAICSETDREQIARQVLDEQGRPQSSLHRFFETIARWRTGRLMDADAGPGEGVALSLCQKYQERLRESGMLDLDELEIEALRLLKGDPGALNMEDTPLSWIFVDEYQDTNPLQVQILKQLVSGENTHICAIGDPDQAIYGFRGADVANFCRFTDDFPGAQEIVLTRNYRSTPAILKGAAAVLGKKRSLIPQISKKDPIAVSSCRTDHEEAEMIVAQIERLMGGTSHFSMDSGRVGSDDGETVLGFGDISILYRLNAQGDALEKALDRAGVPFTRSGEAPLVSRYPATILWRYCQALCYPDIPYYARGLEALKASIGSGGERPLPCTGNKSVSEGISEAVTSLGLEVDSDAADRALSRLRDLAAQCQDDLMGFLDLLSLERGIDHGLLAGDRIALMSLHAAKGLEWEVVFITGCEDRLLPCLLFGDPDLSEETRLFYVGMTRARSRLILSCAGRRALNGRVLQMRPSPFLDRIPKTVRQALDRGAWRPKRPSARQLTLF